MRKYMLFFPLWFSVFIYASEQKESSLTAFGDVRPGFLSEYTRLPGDVANIIADYAGGHNIKLTGHEEPITSIRFSPNGELVLTASEDGTARIWDVETGDLKHTLAGHPGNVSSAEFSPDGKWIATVAEGRFSVYFWNPMTGQLAHELPCLNWIHKVQFSPDSKQVITLGKNNHRMGLGDVKTGNLVHTLTGSEDPINCAVFSNDSKIIATASDDGTVCIWDAKTGNPTCTLEEPAGPVYSVIFTRDDSQVITSGGDYYRTVRLWDIKTATLTRELGKYKYASPILLKPDGSAVVIESGIHDLMTNAPKKELEIELHDIGSSHEMKFNHDGSILIAVGNKHVYILNPTTGKYMYKYLLRTPEVITVAATQHPRIAYAIGKEGGIESLLHRKPTCIRS